MSRLPSSIMEHHAIVWRELLHHGFVDHEYRTALESIVENDRSGLLGGIIGALNGFVGSIGIVLTLLIPAAWTRLFGNLMLYIDASPDEAILNSIEQSRKIFELAIPGFYVLASTSSATLFYFASRARWKNIFRSMFSGVAVMFGAPLIGAVAFAQIFVVLAIATAIGTRILNVAVDQLSSLTFSMSWSYVYWVGLIVWIFLVAAIVIGNLRDAFKQSYDSWRDTARKYGIWWARRPTFQVLENTLNYVGNDALRQGIDKASRSPPGSLDPLRVVESLSSSLLVDRVTARHRCARLGGMVVTQLANSRDQQLAIALLTQISQTTIKNLSRGRYFCQKCVTLVQSQTVKVRNKTFTFWGCRSCGQGHKVLKLAGPLVGVIDPLGSEKFSQDRDLYQWNYSLLGVIGDIDRFEVRSGSDEDLERFLIDLSNDHDKVRHEMYRRSPLWIQIGSVSTNTLSMAREMFGQVKK
ncbi:MAG: hypothetical protein KDB03_01495 [Planctomycetales bacterium]|nr:hypothetical protein [Planctomycetales bacterium]